MIKKIVNPNGTNRTLVCDEDVSLAEVLREQLGLTGTKVGCRKGQCGVCNVIMGGKLVKSCLTKMKRVPDFASVLTIEGVGTPDKLHPLQLAWTVHGAAQCGFCSPGSIMSAKALLDTTSNPTREQVREWFHKNRTACRCTGYRPLVDAVMDAARVIRGQMTAAELAYQLPPDGRIWGGTYPRPSAVAKATGTIDYGADVGCKRPPGTLRLALVQAKVSHANILSIDTSEAEKMPGVEKVVTARDVKGRNAITGLITFPTNKGDGWDRPILCDKKVFQFGDAMAIVCADTEANARAAAEKVKVTLEKLPAYMSAPAAMADDAIEIHPGTPNVYYEQNRAKGQDTKPLMASAGLRCPGRILAPAAAPPDHGAGCGACLFRQRRTADHPLQEHRHSPAPCHDLPGARHRTGQASDRAEPHRWDFRIQVQSYHGSPSRRRVHGHRKTRHAEVRLLSAHHVHGEALSVLHQPQVRGG